MAGEGLKIIGEFLFSIIMYEKEDGSIGWEYNYINNSIPTEIILAPIKAFVREQEDKYYNEDYKNRLPK
mgnify:FL=1